MPVQYLITAECTSVQVDEYYKGKFESCPVGGRTTWRILHFFFHLATHCLGKNQGRTRNVEWQDVESSIL
jgi:hypothetical protein